MNFDGNRGNLVEELDPRMKFILVIVVTVFTFMVDITWLFIYYYALILALFFATKLYKKGIKVLVFLAIMLTIQVLSKNIQNKEFRDSFVIVIVLIQRVSAFVVMGIWMSSNMKVGNFVTALENMRVPKGLTITFAVVFRYIPTIKQEFYYIKNAMKLRGVGINFKNVVFHPIKTFEYSFVPLVIRCMAIADELSASAMTRGLDLKTKRVSYLEVKIKPADILVTLTFIALFVIGKVLSRSLEGGAI